MRKVTINEKNFSAVAAQLVKFFEGSDVVNWYEPRYAKRIKMCLSEEASSSTMDGVYRYSEVHAVVFNDPYDKGISIHLDEGCATYFTIGDMIEFCGSFIRTKRVRVISGDPMLREVYQLWDCHGGFRNVAPRSECYSM